MSTPSTGRGPGRFEIRPGQHRPKHVRNGAIFCAIVGFFLFVIYTKPELPFLSTTGETVTMDVANGANVRPGYTPVRVKGVDVGQVTGAERAPGGKGVRITLRVDDGKGVTVHKDARAVLRWRTLLGRNLYVDLDPGSPSAPELGGEVIAMNRTSSQVELDDALEPLDADGRASTKTILEEFDKGFANAADSRRVLRALEPAMSSIGPGLRAVKGQKEGDLQRLIKHTSTVAGSLAADEVALARLVTDGRMALGVTAARQADLRSLLATAPGSLSEIRQTATRLRTTLDVLDPVAAKLRPGARKIPETADRTIRLLKDVVPLLKDTRPTLTALRPAVAKLPELTRTADATFDRAEPILDQVLFPIIPWLKDTDPESKLKNYALVGPALAHGGSATAWGERYGTSATFEAGVGERAVGFSPCKTFIADGQVPADQKIQCEGISRMLTSLLTGVPPDQVELRGRTVSKSAGKGIFEGESLRRFTREIKRNAPKIGETKKEATR
ncbi:MAG: MlaD family protein [Solirubrobacteraceae bacterium]|nr:MlaD family protein [Solirubrobacteraceae bacterium]